MKISISGISKTSFIKNIIAGLSESHSSPYKKASNISRFFVTTFELNNNHEIDQLFTSTRKVPRPAKELIACPECGNEDNNEDHIGFTMPFQGDCNFCVCQNCGRRTFLSEWNNPLAPEAPFEHDEIDEGVRQLALREDKLLEISDQSMTPFVAVFTQDFSDAEIIPHTIASIRSNNTHDLGEAISYCLKEKNKCIQNGHMDAFFKIGIVDSEGVQYITDYERGYNEI